MGDGEKDRKSRAERFELGDPDVRPSEVEGIAFVRRIAEKLRPWNVGSELGA